MKKSLACATTSLSLQDLIFIFQIVVLANLVVTEVFTNNNLNFKLKGSLTINSSYKTRYKRLSFELVTLL